MPHSKVSSYLHLYCIGWYTYCVLPCIRLLQSLLLEPVNTAVVQQALQVIPTQLLQMLTGDPNPQVCHFGTQLHE